MNDKEILNNAPEGATHWDFNEYIRHEGNGKWSRWDNAIKKWEHTTSEIGTRSLADIKRIEELENALINFINVTSDIYCNSIVQISSAKSEAFEALKEG